MNDKIQADFEAFHRDNPQVYALFDRFAQQMLASRRRHGSAGLIAERIRWETSVVTEGEPVRINNNYRACYARLWEELNPQHRGFFHKRERRPETINSVNVPPSYTPRPTF